MYQPTLASVRQHPLPDWFNDAKLGIFIHWTLSSVPGFAPTGYGDMQKIVAERGAEFLFAHQPYSEWYLNSLRIPGSPVQEYHAKTYGRAFPYESFAVPFNHQSRAWDPAAWADLFAGAGARYVVLVTKHHDGFLLWPSRTRNPVLPHYHTERDVLGELTGTVSARGMKMGVYYSSALDWTFTTRPIRTFGDLVAGGPTSRAYRDYVEAHWKELIDRYDPWVLWSDIGYPPGYRLPELFAYYYNRKPEGVVNDRWGQVPAFLYNPAGRWALDALARRMMRAGTVSNPPVPHRDYATTEYTTYTQPPSFKWEVCRGIGHSFAYNQFEPPEDYLKAPALIRLLASTVANNGNLLINVGPRPDGSIPEPQVAALEGLGRWLRANGEAIYGTRPWTRSRDTGEREAEVAYTQKGRTLFATVTSLPAAGPLSLPDLPVTAATLLDERRPLPFSRAGGRITIDLPPRPTRDEVPVIRFELEA